METGARDFWADHEQAALAAFEASLQAGPQWTPVNPQGFAQSRPVEENHPDNEDVEQVQVDFVMENPRNRIQEIFRELRPSFFDRSAFVQSFSQPHGRQANTDPLPPYDLYNYGPRLAGLTAMPVGPGANTCPLCRSEVFPKPKHGDSSTCVVIRTAIWDAVYRFFDFKPSREALLYRTEILNFIHELRRLQQFSGQDPLFESPPLAVKRGVLEHCLQSITGIEDDGECGPFFMNWTADEISQFQFLGQSLEFNPDDLPQWFETPVKRNAYNEETGAWDAVDIVGLKGFKSGTYSELTLGREEQLFEDSFYEANYDR
ncbi:MAG: hypothetical protein Q9201_002097 [Fulgogasparrea decipioides]